LFFLIFYTTTGNRNILLSLSYIITIGKKTLGKCHENIILHYEKIPSDALEI
jgi:hypothetical protein